MLHAPGPPRMCEAGQGSIVQMENEHMTSIHLELSSTSGSCLETRHARHNQLHTEERHDIQNTEHIRATGLICFGVKMQTITFICFNAVSKPTYEMEFKSLQYIRT